MMYLYERNVLAENVKQYKKYILISLYGMMYLYERNVLAENVKQYKKYILISLYGIN